MAWLSPYTVVEVLVIWVAIYAFLRFLRGTRGKAIVTGFTKVFVPVLLVFAVFHSVAWAETYFPTLNFLAETMGLTFGFGLLILLQPELRQALTNLGRGGRRRYKDRRQEIQTLGEIAVAAGQLAERRRGALMALERSVGLRTWSDTGIALDCRVRSEVLTSIFEGTSSIHDGAVVVVGDRIVAAGCLLPLSEELLVTAKMGTRHRAALGLSERTDAVVVIVSEETGHMGVARGGSFDFGPYGTGLTEEELRETLVALMLGKEQT
jgi:diadenylate cyclase